MVSVGCYELDLLAVQRSLAGLQERLNDLHENAESRFAALVAERDVQAKEKEEAEHALEECRQQLEAKASELQSIVIERDAEAEDNEKLRQQLEQVSACLAEKVAEVKVASERSELALLQLHQVQEELEHYFSLSRRQAKILTSSESLFERTAQLALKSSK